MMVTGFVILQEVQRTLTEMAFLIIKTRIQMAMVFLTPMKVLEIPMAMASLIFRTRIQTAMVFLTPMKVLEIPMAMASLII